MSMRWRFFVVGGVETEVEELLDGEGGATPDEVDWGAPAGLGGRLVLITPPSPVMGWRGGGGGAAQAPAGEGSYNRMVSARRWKFDGGASVPRCGGKG